MNLTLRPATAAAIENFRQRRTALLKTRAILCAAVILLAALTVIALLDRAWLMPDLIRPWFSLAVYAAAAYAAWSVALRFIAQGSGKEGAAKLIEAADPALRERMLSAVELAATGDVLLRATRSPSSSGSPMPAIPNSNASTIATANIRHGRCPVGMGLVSLGARIDCPFASPPCAGKGY